MNQPGPESVGRSGRCSKVSCATKALENLLVRQVETGTIHGAVALLECRDDVEMVAIGVASDEGRPMRAAAIMRIQSMTKVITSVAARRLVESGRLRMDESAERHRQPFRRPLGRRHRARPGGCRPRP